MKDEANRCQLFPIYSVGTFHQEVRDQLKYTTRNMLWLYKTTWFFQFCFYGTTLNRELVCSRTVIGDFLENEVAPFSATLNDVNQTKDCNILILRPTQSYHNDLERHSCNKEG